MDFGQGVTAPRRPWPALHGLPLPPPQISSTPLHRLKTPFTTTFNALPDRSVVFQSNPPLSGPISPPRSISHSASGSTSSKSASASASEAAAKRNSGESSSSSSGLNSLDWRSSTNVYIKGLPERCTNDDLQTWAEQVAKPVSVKTIRDARDHSICTGLGFVRFALPAQAKLFIALVNAVEGYDACFAKETYVGKMEKAADPRSANLYLSHIPLHYTEQDVLALFPAPTYLVRSLRLLHEGDQPGQRAPPGTPFKGAGFIRLDTREMADRAIAELNGKRLPGHGRRPGRSTLSSGELHTYFDTLQVRFADTDTQKLIKKTESEQEKRLALEASGQIPPRSRKGQAYRRLSFSTEQKIRNSSRRGRRGSAVPGDGSLYGPPTSLNPPPFSPALPAPSRGFPSFDVTFGPTSAFRPTTPGLSHTPSLPYAPPNSPVLNSLTSRSYSNDTPPSLGGFTSSSYGSSPGSFSSFSPNPAYMSSYARSNTPLCVRGPSFPPAPHPGIGLGLSFESGSNVSDLHGLGFQGYGNQSYQSMNNTVTGRRGSDALSINSSLEGMTSLFGRSSLHSSSSQLGDSQATYDLAKLGVAPPATPPPEGSHAFFDNTPLDARSGSSHRRPLSRNHQRAHTTALDAFPATPGSYDPDYSPSKLLAPASALARRSSAVEAHIARRKA